MELQRDNMILNRGLVEEIERVREDMIKTGLEEGFTSDRTISISQLLDGLLNELDKIKSNLVL
jgi:stage 0 sporulation regulatory protein